MRTVPPEADLSLCALTVFITRGSLLATRGPFHSRRPLTPVVPLPKFILKESSGFFSVQVQFACGVFTPKAYLLLRAPTFFVTNGAFKRADLFHHNTWT